MNKICYPSLENKLILVTGATSGIGEGVCNSLLKQGAKVIGFGRDKSKIENTLLKEVNFQFNEVNLLELEELEDVLKNCINQLGKLDGIVFCAGKEETIPLKIYKNEKIKSIFELNVFSSIEILRVFSKKNTSNNNASVVFLSSVMGELGQPGKVGYCSTKAAVLGVVKSSALELSNRGIRVNSISPGVVISPMSNALFNNMSNENITKIKDLHPLGLGQIKDICPIVLFLLSNQSSWLTGQNIKIDGGYSIQ